MNIKQQKSGSKAKELKPKHVRSIEALLEKQGVEYYEKNVVNQLVEFMSYYT